MQTLHQLRPRSIERRDQARLAVYGVRDLYGQIGVHRVRHRARGERRPLVKQLLPEQAREGVCLLAYHERLNIAVHRAHLTRPSPRAQGQERPETTFSTAVPAIKLICPRYKWEGGVTETRGRSSDNTQRRFNCARLRKRRSALTSPVREWRPLLRVFFCRQDVTLKLKWRQRHKSPTNCVVRKSFARCDSGFFIPPASTHTDVTEHRCQRFVCVPRLRCEGQRRRL